MSCANQPSTRFNHDELVGVKWRCHLLWRGFREPLADFGHLVRGEVVQHDVDLEIAWRVEIDPLEEREDVGALVRLPGLVGHLAGADVQRGERIRGAVALALVVPHHSDAPEVLQSHQRTDS